MGGVSWPPIRITSKEMLPARNLEKTSPRNSRARVSFPLPRPLRLMYQDEAHFGRIGDTRYCWVKKPLRPLVKAMLICKLPKPTSRG